MSMDPSAWKTASQVAVFFGSFLAGLGGVGVWHFGKVLDDLKTKGDKQRDAEFAETLASVKRDTNTVVERLRPFEEVARVRFPGLPIDNALRKLSDDISDVREIALSATPQSPSPVLRAEVEMALNQLRQHRPQRVVLHFFRETPAIRFVVEEVARMLTSAGLTPERSEGVLPSFEFVPKTAYRIQCYRSEVERGKAIALALGPYLGQPDRIEAVDSAPGLVNIWLEGVPVYRTDGRVSLRAH